MAATAPHRAIRFTKPTAAEAAAPWFLHWLHSKLPRKRDLSSSNFVFGGLFGSVGGFPSFRDDGLGYYSLTPRVRLPFGTGGLRHSLVVGVDWNRWDYDSRRGDRPENVKYNGPAERLTDVWIAVRASLRSVLESISLADLATGDLPEAVSHLAENPQAWISLGRIRGVVTG